MVKNKLNIILPLVLGLLIYIVNRPGIIRNHLCDFLWAYSLANSLNYIGLDKRQTFIITLLTGVVFEVLQLLHLIRGTFDILDILAELLACIICCGRTYEKKLLTILIVCIFFLMGIASGSTEVDEDTTIKKNDNKETIKEELPTIEEQVLFETNGIKVTAKEITNGFLGPELKILVENDSDKDITLELDDIAVNDYMVTAFLYEEVAAGKKSNTSFSIYSSTLKDAGITNIGKLDLYFYIIEQSTYNRIYESDGIELKTSLYDKMDDKLDISGEEMVNQDGIRIVGKGLSKDSIFGSGVVLYIENNSNRNITVSSDNLSVNGYMITSFLHRPLRPNKKAVDTIILSSSDMEENGIEQIDELSLVLEVYDSDTYSTIFKTNELNFNIER